MTTGLDTTLLNWVVELRVPWLTALFHTVTLFGSLPAIAVLTAVVSLIALLDGRRWDATAGVLTMVTAWLLMAGLKVLAGRDRPPPELSLIEISTYSLPSGHAMLSAALAVVAGAIAARTRWMWVLLALGSFAIGVSRIYLGAHWTTDVLAGWVIGTVWGLACMTLAHALQPTQFQVLRRHNPL